MSKRNYDEAKCDKMKKTPTDQATDECIFCDRCTGQSTIRSGRLWIIPRKFPPIPGSATHTLIRVWFGTEMNSPSTFVCSCSPTDSRLQTWSLQSRLIRSRSCRSFVQRDPRMRATPVGQHIQRGFVSVTCFCKVLVTWSIDATLVTFASTWPCSSVSRRRSVQVVLPMQLRRILDRSHPVCNAVTRAPGRCFNTLFVVWQRVCTRILTRFQGLGFRIFVCKTSLMFFLRSKDLNCCSELCGLDDNRISWMGFHLLVECILNKILGPNSNLVHYFSKRWQRVEMIL